MPNPCRACQHPDRTAIDAALLAHEPQRKVAQRYGLSTGAVARHALNHLRQPEHASIQPERQRSRIQRSLEQPPWERQRGESRVAFSAFQTYLEIAARDPDHAATYPKTAEAVQKNKSLISRWSRRWNWRERCDAWLVFQDRAKAARLLRETEEARERWRKDGRNLRDIGVAKLRQTDPQKLTPGEARLFVVDGDTLEAKGLGLDRGTSVQFNQQVALTDGRRIELSEFRKLVATVYAGLEPDNDQAKPTITIERQREDP